MDAVSVRYQRRSRHSHFFTELFTVSEDAITFFCPQNDNTPKAKPISSYTSNEQCFFFLKDVKSLSLENTLKIHESFMKRSFKTLGFVSNIISYDNVQEYSTS